MFWHCPSSKTWSWAFWVAALDCVICGYFCLWVVQWLGLWWLFAVFLEKQPGVCKELIFLGNYRRIPVGNSPGSQALTSLAASLPPHWAQILMCPYFDSDPVRVAQHQVRAQQCFCQTWHADCQAGDEAKLGPGSRTCGIQATFCTPGVCLWVLPALVSHG